MRLMVTLGGFLGGIDPLNPQAKKLSVARGSALPAHGSLTASAAGHSGGWAGRREQPKARAHRLASPGLDEPHTQRD